MKHFTYILLLLSMMVIVSSCVRQSDFPVGEYIFCDAEKIDKELNKFIAANNDAILLDGGKKQTSVTSFSGDFSIYTEPGNLAFAFGIKLKDVGPDWYLRVSVWRKSKDGKGSVVAAAKNINELYLATSKPSEIGENGWEKLVLDVFTPPNFYADELRIYAWNNSTDSVYYDDFKIERLSRKTYPEYSHQSLNLYLDTSDHLKIYNKRLDAFKKGVLQTEDNDWVKAILFADDEMMKCRIRLKGDWLDHLRGDKWSFRIKMRKGFAWNRLRTFSVQTPASRQYLFEWLAHQFYTSADVLTTRYGFIPLKINDQNRGLYAWEEHFDKQLLEYRNRREGPIVKFSEDAFWQTQRLLLNSENAPELPYYEASVIEPFKASRTTSSPTLFAQFKNAQRLMYQYKNHLKPIEDIFDIDKLGAYYAMLDLTQTRHGMVWHNQRMYFNPVLCKLEPIAFDCHLSHSEYSFDIGGNLAYMALSAENEISPETYLLYDLFTNRKFVSIYLHYLESFSSEEFVSGTLERLSEQTSIYDSLLLMEFPFNKHDNGFFVESAAGIRNYLPKLNKFIDQKLSDTLDHFRIIKKTFSPDYTYNDTPKYFVNAYLQSTIDDSAVIHVDNFLPSDLKIVGTGLRERYIDNFIENGPLLKAYQVNKLNQSKFKSDSSANFVFFQLEGFDDLFSVPVRPWPVPEGPTSQQQLMEFADLKSNILIDQIVGSDIYIKTGRHAVDKPVVFPEGYIIHIQAGTYLDFTNQALFLSYSPVKLKGTEQSPIVITSSDFSAQGFTVLQAQEQSIVEHVVFENFNTLDYQGWTHTGAVTFYESDVNISNTKFYRNQCEDALNTIRSNFTVDHCQFELIFGDAFDSDFCTGLVSNSSFVNIGNDAIDFSGSKILIKDTEVLNANDKGISGGENSNLTVINTNIYQSNIGIASKDLSIVKVESSSISDCEYGLVLLQKKAEYGPADIEMINTKILNARTEMLIEKGSMVLNNGKKIKGNKEKLADIFYE